VPHHEKPKYTDVKAPKNYKDPKKIEAYQKANLLEYWKKQALNPHQGTIFCISYAVNNEEPQVIRAESETEMLEQLFEVLDNLKTLEVESEEVLLYEREILMIAHNIEFDALWIYQRALRYGMPKLAQMFLRRNDKTPYYMYKQRCTMYLAGGGIQRNYKISLNNLADLLQIDSNHKSAIDGSMIFDYWLEGNIEVILNYCADDVRLLREIYKIIGYEF
jgi:DNA polymerase elongation subunit (family B)